MSGMKKARRRAVAAACGVVALGWTTGAAALDATCTFETICFEADPCDTATLALRVRSDATTGKVTLGPRGDRVAGRATAAPSGATVIVARGPTSFQLLTVLDRGARYSVHLTDGPAVVTYLGTCEAE